MDSRINSLIRQNQQLKMELTQLRNAFDLNRQVLYVLSTKSQPTKRHFYIMLKKMNQHILDLAENQFKARKDRVNTIQQCKQWQIKYEKCQMEIQQLKKQINNLHLKVEKLEQNKSIRCQQKNSQIFTPKQLHIILTEQIRKISNELFMMGNIANKLKLQNQKLKKYVQNFQDGLLSSKNSRIGSCKNLQQLSPLSNFGKKASIYQKMQKQNNELDYEREIYNSEDQQELPDINGLDREINTYATSRRFSGQFKLLQAKKVSKKQDIQKQIKGYEEREHMSIMKIRSHQKQIQRIKLQNMQLNNRLQLLINSQKTILNKMEKSKKVDKQDQVINIIKLVQWRYKLKYLDDQDILLGSKIKLTKAKSALF